MSFSRLSALVAGAAIMASCGTLAPTASSVQSDAGTSFKTAQFCGGVLGVNPYGYPFYGGYGAYPQLFGLDLGIAAPYGGFGAYGLPFGSGYPCASILGSDLFGGATVLTDSGKLDRQPASLPPGIAEENDVAYRPLGSDIWQPK